MKKILSITMAVFMLMGALSLTVFGTEVSPESADVYVTVADNSGKLVLVQEKISATDKDGDGKVTVDEALFAAHKAKYEGGAEAGYASVATAYGLSLMKLWGDESGSFGYYVNNASAMSLAVEVKDGDHINAFIYTDLVMWSDTYCFFDSNTVSVKEGEEISLTLKYSGFDASWNTVVLPVEGATITIDGEDTQYKTDADGKVTVKLDKAGDIVISATSETMTLVPPVCKAAVEAKAVADVTEEPEETPKETPDASADVKSDTSDKKSGCNSSVVGTGAALVTLFGAFGYALNIGKKNEK